METHGRYLEAAELHLSEKRPLGAIRDLLKEGSRDAVRKATEILLDGLWHRCSFAIAPKIVAADRDVTELLKLARELPVDFVDSSDYREVCLRQKPLESHFLIFFVDIYVSGHREGGLGQPRGARQ